MSKKSTKTNSAVADALRVLADHITNPTVEVEQPKGELKTYFAVFQQPIYKDVYDLNGRRLTDPEKIAAYYKANPAYDPSRWSVFTSGAQARFKVEVKPGEEKEAMGKLKSALDGLKLLNDGQTPYTNYEYKYHAVKIEELAL